MRLGRIGMRRFDHLQILQLLSCQNLFVFLLHAKCPEILRSHLHLVLPLKLCPLIFEAGIFVDAIDVHLGTSIGFLAKSLANVILDLATDLGISTGCLEERHGHTSSLRGRHRPLVPRRFEAALHRRSIGEPQLGRVLVDDFPFFRVGVEEDLVTIAVLLLVPCLPVLRANAIVGAVGASEAVHANGPGAVALGHLQVLAIRHQPLHVALQAHLPVDLDLFVNRHVVGVANDGTIRPQLAIRHPGPSRKARKLGCRMLEVGTKVEGRPAPQGHRGVQHLTFGNVLWPKGGRFGIVPLSIRGEPHLSCVNVDGHAHHDVLVQFPRIVTGDRPVPVPRQFLSAMPSQGVLSIHRPAVIIVPHAATVAHRLGSDDELIREETHLCRFAAAQEFHFEVVAALLLREVWKSHRDPLGRAVGGHAPQHLGLRGAVVRQRGVRQGHLDQLPQLTVIVFLQHMRILVQHSQARSFDSTRIGGGEGGAQAHIFQHEVRVTILVSAENSSVVVHHTQGAILAAFEGLRLVVGSPKELRLPALANHIAIIQSPTGGSGLELVPVELVRLEKAPHVIDMHVDAHRRQVLDPSQHRLQLLFAIAHFGEAFAHCGQGLIVVHGCVGAHMCQGFALTWHASSNCPHLGLWEDGGPEGLLLF
mmetsp:Transcript_71164/g.117033  ORF Transcript_71164/g.117033 Transcript_71164/m.117033 type:complete len:646 (-) Transcript_71164:436-2373(-)